MVCCASVLFSASFFHFRKNFAARLLEIARIPGRFPAEAIERFLDSLLRRLLELLTEVVPKLCGELLPRDGHFFADGRLRGRAKCFVEGFLRFRAHLCRLADARGFRIPRLRGARHDKNFGLTRGRNQRGGFCG